MADLGLNKIMHAPIRLQICSMLAVSKSIEFKAIAEVLDISNSSLSKNLKQLEDAVYIETRPMLTDSRKIAISMTQQGRLTFDDHVKALQAIIQQP